MDLNTFTTWLAGPDARQVVDTALRGRVPAIRDRAIAATAVLDAVRSAAMSQLDGAAGLGLLIATEDLVRRDGLGSGHPPDAFLDWCDARAVPYPDRLTWAHVLRSAVRRAFLPLLQPLHVEVRDVDAIALSPLALDRIDGRPVTHPPSTRSLPDRAHLVTWDQLGDLLRLVRAGDITGVGWRP